MVLTCGSCMVKRELSCLLAEAYCLPSAANLLPRGDCAIHSFVVLELLTGSKLRFCGLGEKPAIDLLEETGQAFSGESHSFVASAVSLTAFSNAT